jgi:solute carrier family 13 (sodium-dependent dicarboxylate transporter), member 2/3/5
MVALIPVMIFTMFGIINAKDLKKLDWDVLILVAGGLTLGVAMKSSGLSDILANLLTHFPLSTFGLLTIVVLFSIILSNFMSNTSAANVIIPIVTSLAVIDPKIGALGVALACSLAMSLPISTPPNAIAFATHAIDTRELAKYGTLMSFFGVVCILILLFILQSI